MLSPDFFKSWEALWSTWMRYRENQVSAMTEVVVLSSWAGDFALTVPFSAQEYKWVAANWKGDQAKPR